MVARWNDPKARPLFKGRLIDGDGCCCAQGDVLRMCGWSDRKLRKTKQRDADCEVAARLGISRAHAVLLRRINDSADGCPQDVLAHPERILGDQAARVLSFWRRLDSLTEEHWAAVRATAVRAALGTAAWHAACAATEAAPAVRDAPGNAARAAADDVRGSGWAAARATNEIQGASRLQSFFFLPLFGINDPAELDT
jgi:hypothetical protein